MADGTITLKTDVDTSGVSAGMGKIKSAAGKVGKAFAAAGAAGAAAFVAIGKAAVSSYADYEQLVGGVETLFKESSDIVMKYAENAYETAGLSANEYMETVTSFSASLLQSLGNDTAKAAEYGNQAVIDMSDNANKMGTDISRIQDAYQGFAKQNFTMLDNLKLGYGGTKTEMERLLEDAEKIKKANGEMADYSIDSFADIVEAIHVVQDNMGITGTTAKEAATTIQGSLNMVKSSWKNLLTGVSDDTQDFDKLLNQFVDSVKTFAKNILPRIKTVFKGIPKLIKALLPEAEAALQEFMPQLLSAGLEGAKGLSGVAKALAKTLPKVVSQAAPQIAAAGFEISQNLIDGMITGINELSPSLTVAMTTLLSVFSAIKIAPIVSGIVSGFRSIMSVLAEYEAALATQQVMMAASERVTFLLASTMKPLELLIGVLTGKVTLATAAQVAWNAAMSLNPAVLIAGGLAALTGAVIGVTVAYGKYIDEHSEVVKATREMAEAAEEAAQRANELKTAFESATENAAENISNAEAEAYANEKLADELYDLADKTTKTADEKARMRTIVDTLNKSVDGLNLKLDNETGHLNLTKDAVKNLIKQKLELAKVNAVQDLYSEQLKNQYKAQMEARTAAEGLRSAYSELNGLLKQGTPTYSEYNGTIYRGVKYTTEQQKAIDNCRESIKKYEKTIDTSRQAVKDANGSMVALSETAGVNLPDSFTKSKKESEQFFNTLQTGAESQKRNSKEIQDSLTRTEKVAENAGANVGPAYNNATAEGIRKSSGKVKSAVNDVVKSAKNGADTSGFVTVGVYIAQGIAVGITKGSISVGAAVKNLINNAKATAQKTAYIKSPSKLFCDEVGVWIPEGIASGILKAATSVYDAIKEVITNAAKSEWLRRLDLADNLNAILAMQDEQLDDMLESEKRYYVEKRRLEFEADEKEYKERLAAAKDAAEIEKIKQERIEAQEKKGQEAYLERLKETGEKERKINEARVKNGETVVDALKSMYDSLQGKIEQIAEAQTKFADKLKTITADVISSVKARTSGLYDNYVSKFAQIGKDLDAQGYLYNRNLTITRLKQYREMMLELKDREGMTDAFYDYLMSKDFESGYKLAQQLLKQDAVKFKRAVDSWQEEQDEIRKTAELTGDEITAPSSLTDWKAKTQALQEYADAMKALGERSGDATDFFREIRDMDVTAGFEQASDLLALSDKDFEQYLSDWKAYQELAKRESKTLYKSEADELADEISDKFDEVKQEFFNVGTDAAEQFEMGFIQYLKSTLETARDLISGSFNNLFPIGDMSAIGAIQVPAMATGGVVPHATLAMIGERGREAVLPLENNTQWMDVLANKVAARTGSGQTTVILQVGEREFGRAVVELGGKAERVFGTRLVTT